MENQLFNKYWNDKEKYEQDRQSKIVMTTPAPSMSPLFNHSILFRTIEDRNNMSDSELRYFIQNNFLAIMNNVFDRSVGSKYISAFQDSRFLDAFIDVISNMQYFDSDVIVRINLLAYHYATKIDPKPEITRRMLRMSSIVNRYKIIAMKKFNMPEDLERYLLIARYSDFNLNICVKRVDLMMISSPKMYNLLEFGNYYEASENSIHYMSNILMELYKPEEWIYVLPYMMTDVLPDNDDTPQTQWITPEVEAVDSTISLAILHILDTMIESSTRLRGILVSYAEGYRIMNLRQKTRFSFQSISYDYPRIKNVLYELENEEKIYVP